MFRSPVLACVAILALICALIAPSPARAFLDFNDPEDTLKTTGIIIGITAGVVLLVVLIVGTVKDIKGGEEEEEDIWADLRNNRALQHVPSLFAGPDLLDGMRASLLRDPGDSPVLPSWARPSVFHGDTASSPHAGAPAPLTLSPDPNLTRGPAACGHFLADARGATGTPSDPARIGPPCDETPR